MLRIYLNDHLAGATASAELTHRTARSPGGGKNGATLRRLAAEIAQDRASLKVGATWVGEKPAD